MAWLPGLGALRVEGLEDLAVLLSACLRPAGEALVLRGRRPASIEAAKAPAVEGEVVSADFVELDVPSGPWQVAKLLVPSTPVVARWWTEAQSGDFSARVETSLTGLPRLILDVPCPAPASDSPTTPVKGHRSPQSRVARSVVELPESAVAEQLSVLPRHVTVDFEPFAGVGPVVALLVVFPVTKGGAGLPGGLRAPKSGVGKALEIISRSTFFGSGAPTWRWILLPWFVLALPLVVGRSIGPLPMLLGVVMTLASVVVLSFLAAIVLVLIQRRCTMLLRRWQRLWRLRALRRAPARVAAAFGEAGPCCICLGEPSPRETLIALLPCRHAMHDDCYRSWVSAEAYPSHELICPLCRRRADAIGKLPV